DQIKAMLEQQWLDPRRPRILQVSGGFSYAFDNDKPFGERVIAERMMLNDARIAPAQNYRVTVNNYLAQGGDGFAALKDGTNAQFGAYDSDALFAYFLAKSEITPTTPDRIARVN
ncbi:5'-nucleotidase, partial [Bradyrhizobium sp.]|uniref:5'-nucleotidase C-terminal domain-containing protein n=1 Tax=Bradyrhizobium sp. TaxID=376 RepID=UPI001EC3DDBB